MNYTIEDAHGGDTKIGMAKAVLDGIIATHGKLTPELVLESAKPKDSPIHGYFTWDSKQAAHKMRLLEAAMLIRTIKVRVTMDERDPVRIRAFVNITQREGHYHPIQTVLEDVEKRVSMVGIAKVELENYKERYEHLAELADLWPVVDETLDKLDKLKDDETEDE